LFSGLSLKPMDVQNPKGTLAIRKAKLQGGQLPNGVLYPLTTVSKLIINKANLQTLDVNMLFMSTKLTYLSLNDNPITSIPSGFLEEVEGLSELHLYGINWTCSCSNMWIKEYCKAHNITLYGDIVCQSPSSYASELYVRFIVNYANLI